MCTGRLVFGDLQVRLKNKRITAAALTGTVLLVFVLSLVFDIAYGQAMQQMDAREVLGKTSKTLSVRRQRELVFSILEFIFTL